jgi:hypothetical protein
MEKEANGPNKLNGVCREKSRAVRLKLGEAEQGAFQGDRPIRAADITIAEVGPLTVVQKLCGARRYKPLPWLHRRHSAR